MKATQGGEYEYEIDLPGKQQVGNIGESVGSNPGSVIGHYADMGQNNQSSANNGSQININNNFGSIVGNINVKMSMLKIGERGNDIRDRDMDMSPKSSKNEINFHN
mmetsp:Transcript_30457/g.46661  ORF Transcript_30457/g.46661 Transcript_30457/m.46661 type:complete len:106 (+) Transcript_30457:1561-1878(+)